MFTLTLSVFIIVFKLTDDEAIERVMRIRASLFWTENSLNKGVKRPLRGKLSTFRLVTSALSRLPLFVGRGYGCKPQNNVGPCRESEFIHHQPSRHFIAPSLLLDF